MALIRPVVAILGRLKALQLNTAVVIIAVLWLSRLQFGLHHCRNYHNYEDGYGNQPKETVGISLLNIFHRSAVYNQELTPRFGTACLSTSYMVRAHSGKPLAGLYP